MSVLLRDLRSARFTDRGIAIEYHLTLDQVRRLRRALRKARIAGGRKAGKP